MRPVMEVCQISHAATYQYRGARDRCYFKQIDCCVSPVFVRVVSKKVVSEEYIDVTRIKKPELMIIKLVYTILVLENTANKTLY